MTAPPTSNHPVVWFLVATADRTGVPVALERMLRWLASTESAEVHVVIGRDGPLAGPIAGLASSTVVLQPALGRSHADAAAVALTVVGQTALGEALRTGALRRRVRSLPRPDVVVVHGAAATRLLPAVAPDVPTVVCLHELDVALDRCIDPTDRLPLFGTASHVMAVSDPVRDLAVRWGAPLDRTSIVPGAIGPDDVVDRTGAARRAARLRLGVGPDTVVVGGAGTPGWRKGTDRFVALAHELSRRSADVAAHWVGGHPTLHHSDLAGTTGPVRWHEVRPDPWALLDGADVIVVPSREDPLPLVALEAGARGIPVVAASTGGLPALLAAGRGVVVAGHDLLALADAVTELVDDPDRAGRATGLAAYVTATHSASVVGPAWWAPIAAAAGSGRSRPCQSEPTSGTLG